MESSFGEFLKQKRREKELTQKELANFLFVSESAVSKWEKNVAHPDITLLPKLSEILGVTEHELITASVDRQARQEKAQARKWRAFSMTWSLFFYISYCITILTCFICNLAVNGTLSWFWIVVSALLLAFTFTNLPKLIKKHRLILLPLSMFLALCILLATCAIYTKGNWFWIATLPVLLVLVIIFSPIYISKIEIFSKIKKFNDFISVGIDFVMLNILLVVINIYSVVNNDTAWWYINIALPIVVCVYLFLNLLLSVRFIKINRFLKTSIILSLIDLFIYMPPLFIKAKSSSLQDGIDSANIFMANLSNWQAGDGLQNNVHCIIFLTIMALSIIFFVIGLIRNSIRQNQKQV
ncbi:MAG: helix-turn-helix transcriptional regulator [Clostridia bacterium]|nr:helix-turn-helix transcriptional regulator [Clostridia bacterium]